MLIAGDIGGTKTDLAIFSNEAGPLVPLAQTRVPSADFPSLQAIVKQFSDRVDGAYKEILADLRRKGSDLPALARR